MTCWYELRGADNRLVELRRGFTSEVEAWEAAAQALAKIKAVAPMAEPLTIVTGVDPEPTIYFRVAVGARCNESRKLQGSSSRC